MTCGGKQESTPETEKNISTHVPNAVHLNVIAEMLLLFCYQGVLKSQNHGFFSCGELY